MASVETLASMSFISYHHVFHLCSYLLWWLFFKLYYTGCCCFFFKSYFIFAVVLKTQKQFFCMFTCDDNKVWSWILVMIKSGVTYASRIAAVQLSGWWRETRRLWSHSASARPLCTCDPEVTSWETDRGTEKTSRLQQTQSRAPDAYSLVNGETLVEQWPLVAEK